MTIQRTMRCLGAPVARTRLLGLGTIGAAIAASLLAATSGAAAPMGEAACSPSTTILTSPRADSPEVQAKAINDRGDSSASPTAGRGTARHAILWKGGKVEGAVDLGVLPGYVASEAYGVNNDRVVFGLLYDKKERTFPFRWENGRMTVLKGPNGRVQQADVPDRNAINERGEMAGTLIVARQTGAPCAGRADGKATSFRRSPGTPGRTPSASTTTASSPAGRESCPTRTGRTTP